MIARLKSAFACVQDRAENSGLRRLFDLRKNGSLSTVVIPFLGQDDHRLKFAPDDLVTREQAYAYPTDFSAMSPVWIERLSRRGEQITRAIIEEHAPELAEGAWRSCCFAAIRKLWTPTSRTTSGAFRMPSF